MSCRHWTLLGLMCLVVAVPLGRADEASLKADLAVLKAGSADTDTKGLIAFFKKRTVSEATRARVAGLIRQLGADEYEDRQKAQTTLVDIGAPARAQLRAALTDTDLEVRRRSRWALDKIGPAAAEVQLVGAAARVLAARKAAGACEVLLDYLPSIEEPESVDEVAAVLPQLAVDKDGKPEPVLLKALADKYPIKRWAAAAALARAAGKDHRAAVHKLLTDASPLVRRRVAVALLEVKDKEGVETLISLLDSKSTSDAEAAEEALVSIAGEKAPATPDDDNPTARDRYKKAWENWWKDNKKGLDLARVDLNAGVRGYTLVGVMTFVRRVGQTGKVMVLDPSMKVRWEVDKVNYPVYACLTRRDRVLVCEFNANRVSEHDSKGKMIWHKNLSSQPVHAQRLANGGTFIATRNQLLELDRNNREINTITRPGYDILTACRHKDGSFTMISSGGQCIKLDKAGAQKSSFTVGYLYSVGLKVHFLPKGGVVVPDYSQGKVREYNANGKLVADFSVGLSFRPNAVTKLANGNYLVCSRLSNAIAEFTKDGKQVSTHNVAVGTGRPLFVERK